MRIVGVTGNIGSGKSTVSAMLQELGAIILDADKVGHELLAPHTEAWHDIVATFGPGILKGNGVIERPRLGDIVFRDPQALEKLNRIMWPRIKSLSRLKLETMRQEGVRVAVFEAAVMIEANWISLVDEVWLTVAPEPVVIQRLLATGRFTEEQARARIRNQMPVEEKTQYAQVIVDTDCTLEELRQRVAELWQQRGLGQEEGF